MDKIKTLLDLGFTKENENTYFYDLSKERKIIVDINVVGRVLGDSVFLQQYESCTYLCEFNNKDKIEKLIILLS